jgi:predicted amidohydrolase
MPCQLCASAWRLWCSFHAVLVVAMLVGCAKDAPPIGRSAAAATMLTVASAQYGSGQAGAVKASCASDVAPDVCALKELVTQAKAQGALLVVVPEISIDQKYYEPQPSVGDDPCTMSAYGGSAIKIFAEQAKQLQIFIVIHVITEDASKLHYSTQVALGPDGKIVGKHHKFELYGSEASSYTPGTDVMVFGTPLGKVGLLICADIYGDLALHSKIADTLGARVIALSSYWTALGAANFQAAFARNWGVYVVGSNTTTGSGVGGGVFDPTGKPLVKWEKTVPTVTVAQIPAP